MKANNTTNSVEQRMRTAPLGKRSREYLVAIGKFNDAMNDLHDIVADEYGGQSCDVIDPASIQFNLFQDELFKLLALNISENLGSLKCDVI